MRIVILSTDTPHHVYFINRIAPLFDVRAVFYETEKAIFNYDVSSPFAEEEKKFEAENFFKNVPASLPETISLHLVRSVNSLDFADLAEKYGAELAVVFGCGRIKPHVIDIFKNRMINIHRGISTFYRGLDSDLWAVYNGDFENIGVTLHYVEEALDTGDILAVEKIKYLPGDKIHHLRYKTTLMAADMMEDVLSRFKDGAAMRGVKQEVKGKYYSAMPADLKIICAEKFENYINSRFEEKCREKIN